MEACGDHGRSLQLWWIQLATHLRSVWGGDILSDTRIIPTGYLFCGTRVHLRHGPSLYTRRSPSVLQCQGSSSRMCYDWYPGIESTSQRSCRRRTNCIDDSVFCSHVFVLDPDLSQLWPRTTNPRRQTQEKGRIVFWRGGIRNEAWTCLEQPPNHCFCGQWRTVSLLSRQWRTTDEWQLRPERHKQRSVQHKQSSSITDVSAMNSPKI